MKHDRDDHGQRQRFGRGFTFDVSLQNAHHVAQDSKRHELVGAALVFEEDVEESGLVRDPYVFSKNLS